MKIRSFSLLAGIAGLFCAAAALSASAEELYTVSSKAQGAPFDLVVTEVKREPRRSHITVPGFHNRTAAGARWLMCAYTDLAVKRGFAYWNVMYPEEGSDVLVVGFSQTGSETLAQMLGPTYKPGSFALSETATPVEAFMRFCGMSK